MKHPQIGKLYRFQLCENIAVHITPVEYVNAGMFKGALMCYVFKPELSAEHLYAHAGRDDLVIPAIITIKEYFKDGTFTYADSDSEISTPLFRSHAFTDDLLDDCNWQREYYDINGVKIDIDVIPDHVAVDGVFFSTGICEEVSKALNLEIDCDRLVPNPAEAARQMKLPSDDHVNRRSMLLVVTVPHGPDACLDPEQDIIGIEDALMAALLPAKLGVCDGDGVGETETDLFLKVRPGKYPEAIKAIRQALADAGVIKYTILWNKP